MNTINLTEARNSFPSVIKNVDEHYARYMITKNGKNKAVIMSPDEIEAYEETIATLSDENGLKEIAKALQERENGEVVSFDDVFGAE